VHFLIASWGFQVRLLGFCSGLGTVGFKEP
jgi:hypothetical protein